VQLVSLAVISNRERRGKLQAFFEERFDRRLAFDLSAAGAIAKSTCRLKRSTRATNTESSSPTLNRLRDRRPMS
jgi:hypothetical protein